MANCRLLDLLIVVPQITDVKKYPLFFSVDGLDLIPTNLAAFSERMRPIPPNRVHRVTTGPSKSCLTAKPAFSRSYLSGKVGVKATVKDGLHAHVTIAWQCIFNRVLPIFRNKCCQGKWCCILHNRQCKYDFIVVSNKWVMCVESELFGVNKTHPAVVYV